MTTETMIPQIPVTSNTEIFRDMLGDIDRDLEFWSTHRGIPETRRLMAAIRNVHQFIRVVGHIASEQDRQNADMEKRLARLEAQE